VGVFYPSARVKLAIRIDEGAATGDLRARLNPGETPPAGTTSLPGRTPDGATSQEETQAQLTDVQATIDGLINQRDDFPPDQYDFFLGDLRRRRDMLQEQLAQTNDDDRPEALAGAPPDDLIALGTILPEECSIDRNGIRTADTARVTIDYRDAPFDPRLIRSCGIEIIVGVVPPGGLEQGVAGQTRDDGTALSLVPRGQAGAPAPEGTTRFLGFVDEWTITLDGEDGDSITLECRDLTAVLIDTPLPSGVSIDLSLPIDEGIRGLLDSLPSTRGTSVRYGIAGEQASAPTPGTAVPRARRGRRGGRTGRARAGGSQMNVWDHITEVCVPIGLVPLFEDSELRILNPRTFFEGRDTARRMVYGRNLKALSFTRKLGGTKVPTIEVRCYDPAIGRTRWARYPVPGSAPNTGVFGQTDPPRPARANEVPPSGSNPDDRIMTQSVAGITDPATLAAAAESIWHQVGRQELEGNFATDEVASWEEPTEGVDLLRLRPGDPVELLVASAETADLAQGATLSNATELRGLQQEARTQYLQNVGWSRQVAERFSALQDAVSFQTIFRTQDVRITWSQGSGLDVAVDFINFLEIRELGQERSLEAGPSPEVAELTDGQSSDAAEQLRRISGVRRLVTTYRENGLITEEQYDRQMEELTAIERRRVGNVQEGQS
jgi:hypothetical protein